jgi:hypothetical protein
MAQPLGHLHPMPRHRLDIRGQRSAPARRAWPAWHLPGGRAGVGVPLTGFGVDHLPPRGLPPPAAAARPPPPPATAPGPAASAARRCRPPAGPRSPPCRSGAPRADRAPGLERHLAPAGVDDATSSPAPPRHAAGERQRFHLHAGPAAGSAGQLVGHRLAYRPWLSLAASGAPRPRRPGQPRRAGERSAPAQPTTSSFIPRSAAG